MFLHWLPYLPEWLLSTGRLTVDLIVGLAWPIVVLTLVLIFRKPLQRFISEAREMTGWGASIKRGDSAASEALAQSLESEAQIVGQGVISVRGEVHAEASTDGEVEATPPRVESVHELTHQSESRLLSQVHGKWDDPLRESRDDFELVMAAGQAVWEALRIIAGRNLGVPSSPSDMRSQLGDLQLPPPILDTLESIVEVYNGVVIRNSLRLSHEGYVSFVAACTNAIKQLGSFSRRAGYANGA